MDKGKLIELLEASQIRKFQPPLFLKNYPPSAPAF